MYIEKRVLCIEYQVFHTMANNFFSCPSMSRLFKISVKDRFSGQAPSLLSHNGVTTKIVKEKLTPFNFIYSRGQYLGDLWTGHHI